MDIRPIDANALKKQFNQFNLYDNILYARAKLEEAPTLSLNTLRDAIYEDAVAHGLYERYEYYKTGSEEVDNRCRMRDLAIRIREETVELYDAVDLNNPKLYAEELADVVIMCFSVAGKLGIDIDAAIRRKMEINKNRPWKHEGEEK